eukprot:m.199629 g.199629  ORF g.199629 m.199629 type:complete len:567 (+) comp32741_c0_seq2:175-1875(+)
MLPAYIHGVVRFKAMLLVSTIFALAGTVSAGGCSGDCSKLTLDSGEIEGKIEFGNAHFLGIPFGRPPVGDLRWEPPQPPLPWTDVLSTKNFTHCCMQSAQSYTQFSPPSEDCLYLNMWLPKDVGKTNKTYPIMIFFHGGSYITGTAMTPIYGGESAMHLNENTIIIVANYRLGVFGYLGSDRLRASDGSTGNFGLQDQRAAMKWAQTNAASFWGDDQRITIFGESAGAGSTSTHLVAPKSEGFFNGAIMESGPLASWLAKPMFVAEKNFDQILQISGCSNLSASQDQVKCLRNVSATDALHMFDNPHCGGLIDWNSVIDGVELSAHPRVLAANGKIHDVPILLGTNRDEGTLFVGDPDKINASTYTQAVTEIFGAALAPKVIQQYPPTRYPATKVASSAWWTLSHVFGDSAMSCPARQTANWIRAAPGRKNPVFMYFFDHEMDVLSTLDWISKTHAYGVCHASELALVFRFSELLVGKEQELSDDVVTWWEHFAATGSPGMVNGAPWPAFTITEPQLLMWGMEDDKLNFTLTSTLKKSDCDFWEDNEVPLQFAFGKCAFNSTSQST